MVDCPNQLGFRTTPEEKLGCLSESAWYSDYSRGKSGVPVRISPAFGLLLTKSWVPSPNQALILTTPEEKQECLSESAPFSDSFRGKARVPVRIHRAFGLHPRKSQLPCPNHPGIQTIISYTLPHSPPKVNKLSPYSHFKVILSSYTDLIEEFNGGFHMNIVEVKNLSKVYGKGETAVKALDNVSFSVKKGEFVCIIGPSGSGKSTLLHMLGGVDRPTSGKVLIDQTDIYDLNETQLAIFRRRQIGLIYQFYNLIPILTVEENMTLPMLLDEQKVDPNHLNKIVDILGLTNRLSHLPNQLSGGQQQRVSIGRALISNPAIILADEPTGNLDSKNSEEIMELLKMFNKTYNQTLIVITHDERIALQADRIISIEDGKVAKDEVTRP